MQHVGMQTALRVFLLDSAVTKFKGNTLSKVNVQPEGPCGAERPR